jgi:hypothetical protein
LRKPRISPNLQMITVENRPRPNGGDDDDTAGQGDIYLLNYDGTGVRALSAGGDPSWSADGLNVLMTTADAGLTHASAIAADGTSDTPEPILAQSTGHESQPELSPDGTMLLYVENGDAGASLDRADPDGTDARRFALPTEAGYVTNPRFSADQTQIYFTAHKPGFWDGSGAQQIWGMAIDGTNLHRLTALTMDGYGAASGDGNIIITTSSHFIAGYDSGSSNGDTHCLCANFYIFSPGRTIRLDGNGGDPTDIGLPNDSSGVSIAPTAHAAYTGDRADEIRRAQGIDQLGTDLAAARDQAVKTPLGRQFLKISTEDLIRIGTRASIVAMLAEPYFRPDTLSCEEGGIDVPAKELNRSVGALARQIAGASVTGHPILQSRAASFERSAKNLRDAARDVFNETSKECKGPYKVAYNNAAKMVRDLSSNQTYLHELDFQHQRQVASATADAFDQQPERVRAVPCDDAKELVDSLGRGAGLNNHVVYWAPPPPLDTDVRYIGRSRALDARCSAHDDSISSNLMTLHLPPLNLLAARGVEEALIAHFGYVTETKNGDPGTAGQLLNKRHEIAPEAKAYCGMLLVGQFLLLHHGYGRYAAAHFTRGKQCPGVGGPI